MTNILLAPHNDDETLFASFLCMKYRPKVIVCLRSRVQEGDAGISHQTREKETQQACNVLGCEYEQWTYSDSSPDWRQIELDLRRIESRQLIENVFAPAYDFEANRWHPEENPIYGLFHHDKIGLLAERVFGNRVVHYQTYSRYGGRVEEGIEIEPTPEMVVAKLTAMTKYQSQIAESTTRSHFVGTIKEWIK